MLTDAQVMERCLQLARNGERSAAPNPLVGAVLVQGDRVLAEGWHERAGGSHAEVVCLGRWPTPVPKDATLYVNLEPCSHHGRTPPCADLIIERGVKKVVIAHVDPYAEVSGRGIERLRMAGVHVEVGVEADHARWLNRRFLTSIERSRPYIVLKWARTIDGFIDGSPRAHRGSFRISSPTTDVLVHGWRATEQAIMVGSRTVVQDDPRLDVRHTVGRDPLRVVLDRDNSIPSDSHIFTDGAPTWLATRNARSDVNIARTLLVGDSPLPTVLEELHRGMVRSILIEGGAELIGHFLRMGLWDEARVITGAVHAGTGTLAPALHLVPTRSFTSGSDRIDLYTNNTEPLPRWSW